MQGYILNIYQHVFAKHACMYSSPAPPCMKRMLRILFLLSGAIGLLLTSLFCSDSPASETLIYQIDFTQAGKDGRAWLKKQGFTLKKDMTGGDELQLLGTGNDKGLRMSTKEAAFGVAVKEGLSLKQIHRVVLEWGVEHYPAGASWEKQINREALMVTLFFGTPVKADHFYLPDSPYFIGLFLCQGDKANIPYTAKSYQETARYVCLESPPPGITVSSEFKINEAYTKWFATESAPPLTGIGIEVDTSDLDPGRAAAFLKRITFYDDGK